FLGFCLFFSSLLLGQEKYSIRGTIKDVSNGETLLGATVFLKGTTQGTITNEYGFFSLTAPKGNYSLMISYLGYESLTKEVELNTDLTLNFELIESTTALKEVIIVADESEQMSIKKPQMGVSKLNSGTIKQRPAVLGEIDVVKSIQMLPGVTNNGEGSSGFNVRGVAVDQNLVLLDEAIIYNTSHFFGF